MKTITYAIYVNSKLREIYTELDIATQMTHVHHQLKRKVTLRKQTHTLTEVTLMTNRKSKKLKTLTEFRRFNPHDKVN